MNAFRRGLSCSLLNRAFQEKISSTSVRYLYNEQFLAMDRYIEGRQRTLSRIGTMKENFYYRMKQQLNSATPSMIFTEDLKTVIHSCEDKQEELDTVVQMIKRFHKQNKELRFGTFVFGPVAMRLFYHLQKQDMMKDFMQDPELNGFFDQLKSYLLCMDLYFKKGMYQDVLDAFVQLKEKNISETRFPREAMVLAMGSCYKLNTAETYQIATDNITHAREARVTIVRKALLFVCALALNQNKADVALEILSSIDRLNNITGNNLRLLAYSKLGRMDDAFDILRRVTDQDAPVQNKIRGEICQETLDALQTTVEKIDDKESSHIFEQLCRSLKESNSVTSQTMDDLVCLPIEPRQFLREGDSFQFRQRNFPDQPFRSRERSFGDRNMDRNFGDRNMDRNFGDRNMDRNFGDRNMEEFPTRRRRFAGLMDDQ